MSDFHEVRKVACTATQDIVMEATSRLMELCRDQQEDDLIPTYIMSHLNVVEAPARPNSPTDPDGSSQTRKRITTDSASSLVMQAKQSLVHLKRQLDALPVRSKEHEHEETDVQREWQRSVAELISIDWSQREMDSSSIFLDNHFDSEVPPGRGTEVASVASVTQAQPDIGSPTGSPTESDRRRRRRSPVAGEHHGVAAAPFFELKHDERLAGNSSDSSLATSARCPTPRSSVVSQTAMIGSSVSVRTSSFDEGVVTDADMGFTNDCVELLEDALRKIKTLNSQNHNLMEEMTMRDNHIHDLEQMVGEQRQELVHRENREKAPPLLRGGNFGEYFAEHPPCREGGTLGSPRLRPCKANESEGPGQMDETPPSERTSSGASPTENPRITMKALSEAWEQRRSLPKKTTENVDEGHPAPASCTSSADRVSRSSDESSTSSPWHLALAWHVDRLSTEIVRKDDILSSKERALQRREEELAERARQVDELQRFVREIRTIRPPGASHGRRIDESPLSMFRDLSKGGKEPAFMQNDLCLLAWARSDPHRPEPPLSQELDEPKADVSRRRESLTASCSSAKRLFPPASPQLVSSRKLQDEDNQSLHTHEKHPPQEVKEKPQKDDWIQPFKQQHVIAVDLDDVVCSFVNNFRHWFLHERQKQDRAGHEVGEGSDPLCEFFLCSASAADPESVPGASEGLKRLRAAGLSLELVTSRPEAFRSTTQEMVNQHFPGIFDKLHFTEQKWWVCQKIGARVLIDDSVRHVKDAAAHGVSAVLFDLCGTYSWNQNFAGHPGVVRCSSWESTVDWILGFIDSIENVNCDPKGAPQLPKGYNTTDYSLNELKGLTTSAPSRQELPRSPPIQKRAMKDSESVSDFQQELMRFQSIINRTSMDSRGSWGARSADRAAGPAQPRQRPQWHEDTSQKYPTAYKTNQTERIVPPQPLYGHEEASAMNPYSNEVYNPEIDIHPNMSMDVLLHPFHR